MLVDHRRDILVIFDDEQRGFTLSRLRRVFTSVIARFGFVGSSWHRRFSLTCEQRTGRSRMTCRYGGHAAVKDYSRIRLLNSSFNCKKDSPVPLPLTRYEVPANAPF